MEEELEIFISQKESSALVKSFWAGKLLQKLKLGKDDRDKLADYLLCHEDRLTPQFKLTPHQSFDNQSHSLSNIITEALSTLTICETSLSARVHRLLTVCVQTTDSAVGPQNDHPQYLLEPDATLNWRLVSKYMLGGNSEDKINLFVFYFKTIF